MSKFTLKNIKILLVLKKLIRSWNYLQDLSTLYLQSAFCFYREKCKERETNKATFCMKY